MIEVFQKFSAEKYDGTNGTAVATAVECSVVSDNGTTLVFATNFNDQFTMQLDDWLVWAVTSGSPGIIAILPDGLFQEIYFPAPQLSISTGSEPVPSSTPGGSQNIDVTISPAMPNTDYVPIAMLYGTPDVLPGHSITAVTVLDEETVRVVVQSAPDSISGASAHVVAHELI